MLQSQHVDRLPGNLFRMQAVAQWVCLGPETVHLSQAPK